MHLFVLQREASIPSRLWGFAILSWTHYGFREVGSVIREIGEGSGGRMPFKAVLGVPVFLFSQ